MTIPVVIIGAGGHARVIESLLDHYPEYRALGALDRDASTTGEKIGNTSVIGTWDMLASGVEGCAHVAIAVGDNRARAELYERAKAVGFEVVSLVHPSALIEKDVKLGKAVVVCAGAALMVGATVGANALINTTARVDHESWIGDHAHLGTGAIVAGRARIGEGTFVGAGATVIDQVSIGAWCVVGAGATVVEDLPDNVLALGTPARIVKRI